MPKGCGTVSRIHFYLIRFLISRVYTTSIPQYNSLYFFSFWVDARPNQASGVFLSYFEDLQWKHNSLHTTKMIG